MKTSALLCLGDLALGYGTKFSNFLEEILNLFEMACGAAYTLRNSNSAEDLDYAEELSEVIVEAFTGVIHGIVGSDKEPAIVNHCLKLIPFLFFMCDKERSPTVVKFDCFCLVY